MRYLLRFLTVDEIWEQSQKEMQKELKAQKENQRRKSCDIVQERPAINRASSEH